MPRDLSEFSARKPRYNFTGGEGIHAELEIDQPEAPARLSLRMIDLSRHGFCAEVECELALGLNVVLHLSKEDNGGLLELPGTVCWQRARDEGAVVGCRFEEQLPWETLGELFMEGVLGA